MTKNEEVKQLVEDYMSNPSNRLDQIMNFIRMQHKVLFDFIMDYTKQLPKKYGFSHRLYWTCHNITDFPLCPNCGKPNLRNIKIRDGYDGPKKYCCNSCITKSSEYQQKYAETNMKKYGVKNVFASDAIKEKIKQTNLQKYGFEYSAQNEEVKKKTHQTNIERYGAAVPLKSPILMEKLRQTNLERYGVESTFGVKEFQDKAKQSLMERYGVDNASLVPEFVEKRRQTFLKKFGVDNPLKSQDVLDKVKNTNIERYGYEWSLSSPEIHEKAKQTCLQKYGVENSTQCPEIQERIRSKRLERLYNRLQDNEFVQLLTPKEEFIHCEYGYTQNFKWKCKRCGEIFESPKNRYQTSDSVFYAKCPKCFPLQNFRSTEEQFISNYLKENYPQLDFVYADRKLLENNKEIDIYIPSRNLAIEFDGIRWHSLQMLDGDKNYHLDKTTICENKGVQLIHIFEDEWFEHKNVVLSRLNSILGKYDTKIYARNCEIKELDSNIVRDFLDHNHIQGSCNSKYNLCLTYNNEIVSVMTFGHMRKSLGSTNVNDSEYELLRYCCKTGYCIIGGASKLFKNFIRKYNPTRIISYADRRWSIGKLYYKLGFKLHHISQPNYWYVINNHRQHRFGWRKDVLKDKLKTFDENLTEYENMLYNGYDCIYDCGNLVFEWTK